MSLFGAMNTSISGMQAQTNRLSATGDNIANASTTGYKKSFASFSSMVMPDVIGGYHSGGVETTMRRSVTEQGEISSSTSDTSMAIQGNGFFVVEDPAGQQYLTRAGDFQKDDEGYLVNSGGYRLTGYKDGDESGTVAGGDPQPIQLGKIGMTAVPSTGGIFDVNLPIEADPVTGNTPASNQADSTYTSKTSMTAYDNAGRAVQLDVYYAKSADNTWQVSVFNQGDSLSGGFPYGAAGSAPLTTATLTFDPSTNKLTGDTVLDIPLSESQTISLDLSGSTQLAADFSVSAAKIDGSKAASPTGYSISPDGLVSAKYEDGTTIPVYTVALADVMSPNNMTAVDGTAFQANNESGPIMMGEAGVDGMGTLKSGATEESNVDLASELTDMIESQRVYTANSKVFQTGSEMFDVLNGLKR